MDIYLIQFVHVFPMCVLLNVITFESDCPPHTPGDLPAEDTDYCRLLSLFPQTSARCHTLVCIDFIDRWSSHCPSE